MLVNILPCRRLLTSSVNTSLRCAFQTHNQRKISQYIVRSNNFSPRIQNRNTLWRRWCTDGPSQQTTPTPPPTLEQRYSLVRSLIRRQKPVPPKLVYGIIRQCKKEGKVKLAEEIYSLGKKHLESREIELFIAMTNVYCYANNMEAAMRIYNEMEESRVRPTVRLYNVLIIGWAKAKNYAKIKETEEIIAEKGLHPEHQTYVALMMGYVTVKKTEEVVRVYMKMKKDDKVRIDGQVYEVLLDALQQGGKLDEACELLENLKKSNFDITLKMYNLILWGCIPVKNEKLAWKYFQEISETGLVPDLESWNVLIVCLCSAGFIDIARKRLIDMQERGVTPNLVSYRSIVVSCLTRNRLQDGSNVFNEMRKKGLKPDKELWYYIVECHARFGYITQTCHFVEQMLTEKVEINMKLQKTIYAISKKKSKLRWFKGHFGTKVLEEEAKEAEAKEAAAAAPTKKPQEESRFSNRLQHLDSLLSQQQQQQKKKEEDEEGEEEENLYKTNAQNSKIKIQ